MRTKNVMSMTYRSRLAIALSLTLGLAAASADVMGQYKERTYSAATTANNRYSSRKTPISVNLKQVDIRDLFRLVHEITGMTVVADKDIRSRIDLTRYDSTVEEVLDAALCQCGLSKEIESSTIYVRRAPFVMYLHKQRDVLPGGPHETRKSYHATVRRFQDSVTIEPRRDGDGLIRIGRHLGILQDRNPDEGKKFIRNFAMLNPGIEAQPCKWLYHGIQYIVPESYRDTFLEKAGFVP